MEKQHFVKIVTSLVTVLLKMTLCLCIYFVFTKNETKTFFKFIKSRCIKLMSLDYVIFF